MMKSLHRTGLLIGLMASLLNPPVTQSENEANPWDSDLASQYNLLQQSQSAGSSGSTNLLDVFTPSANLDATRDFDVESLFKSEPARAMPNRQVGRPLSKQARSKQQGLLANQRTNGSSRSTGVSPAVLAELANGQLEVITQNLSAVDASRASSASREAAIERLKNASNRPEKFSISKSRGSSAVRVSGEFPLSKAGSNTEEVAQFLRSYPEIFGLGGTTTLVAEESCSKRFCTVRLKKLFNGLPVFGDSLVAIVDTNKIVKSVTGHMSQINVDTSANTARLSVGNLEAKALEEINATKPWRQTEVEEGIKNIAGRYTWVYRVTVAASPKEIWDVFIDARTGDVVDKLSRVYDQTPFVDSSGQDLAGLTQTFRSRQQDSVYILVDDSFPADSQSEFGDFQNTTDSAVYVSSASNTSGWDPAAVSALKNSEISYNYFLTNHQRQGIDGENGSMVAFVHYDVAMVNAFYMDVEGGVMVYGDGDGVISNNLAGSLDIAGHELTHGVVARTAGLEYRYQSGALNESFADFFGAQIDPDDWLIGEDVWLQGSCGNGTTCLRNLANPKAAYSAQPAHMDEYQNLTLEQDYGGVHVNSGIPNKALYMLAEGLASGSVGRSEAAQLAYDTLTALTPTSNFQDAVDTMYSIASDFYPPSVSQAVIAAWESVGLYVDQGGTDTNPLPPVKGVDASTIVYIYQANDATQTWIQAIDETALGYLEAYDGLSVSGAAVTRASIAPVVSTEYADGYFTATITPEGDLNFGFFSTEGAGGGYAWEQTTTYGVSTLPDNAFTSVSLGPNYASEGNLAYTIDYLPVVFFQDNNDKRVEYAEILGPSYAEDGSTGGYVALVDSIRWDPTGRKVVIDYLACVASTDGQEDLCSWSIAIVNALTGVVSYPLPGQVPWVDLGYPSFTNQSDVGVAFDLHLYSETDPSAYVGQIIAVMETESRQLALGVNPIGTCDGTSPVWTSPSFNSIDNGLIYGRCDASHYTTTHYYDAVSQVETLINPYPALAPTAIPSLPYYFGGALTANTTQMDFGDLPWGQSVTLDGLCINNPVPASSELFDFVSYEGISTSLTLGVYSPGQTECGSVTVEPPLYVTSGGYVLPLIFIADTEAGGLLVQGALNVTRVAPPAPVITSVVVADSDSLLVEFEAGSGGDPDISFTVTCGDVSVEGAGTSLVISGLDADTTYSCTVTASNSEGNATSAAVEATTDPAAGSGLLLLLPALCQTANPPEWCP